MARLIVDEGGRRRQFQVGQGRITIGSGEEARLRLTSPGVAEVHAELELDERTATLHPRPGVLPPLLGANPVVAPTKLRHGSAVRIGEATLTLELPGGAPLPAEGGAPLPGSVRPRLRRPGALHARGAPKKSSAMIWGSLLAALVVAVLLFLLVIEPALTGRSTAPLGAALHVANARELVEIGDLRRAEQVLDDIPASGELSADDRRKIDEVRDQIAERKLESRQSREMARADEYLETQLKGFERKYLQGRADRPHARVFLQRCREFRQSWPSHAGVEWVERHEARFDGVVSLAEPPTFEDLAFEVESLTWANPRAYAEAFRRIEVFRRGASEADRARVDELVDEKRAERAEWFEDRLQQARWHYDRKEPGQAFEWLRILIVHTGDAEMCDRAAKILIEFEDLDERLRGYESSRPEQFQELVAHPIVAGFARRQGIL